MFKISHDQNFKRTPLHSIYITVLPSSQLFYQFPEDVVSILTHLCLVGWVPLLLVTLENKLLLQVQTFKTVFPWTSIYPIYPVLFLKRYIIYLYLYITNELKPVK